MMKSRGLLFLIVLLMVCFAPTVNAVEIGLAWVGKSGMAKRVTAGFDAGMSKLAPQVKVEYRKELSSIDELARVVKMWEKRKSGIVLLRSNAAKWLAGKTLAVPTFIGGCNNPKQLGVVESLESPEKNITGVTYFLPVENQFDIFQEILPEMRSVLLLVGKGNPSAEVDRQGTKNACRHLSFSYKEVECLAVDEAVKAVRAVENNQTTVIIGNQSLLFDSADEIVAAAGAIPVVSYSGRAVKLGALGGFVADDNKLGRMLAESVADVLVKGKSIRATPVKTDPDPSFFVNIEAAEKMGVEFSYSVLSAATIIE
ncbi:MAG: hypothetical protein GY737_13065 [Desulfobacteraceae bacterium]|nr:hypothetical protein [Desulfobacteraceae bacterium]